MTDLTSEEIARIAAYLDAGTGLPGRADLLFVFGTRLLAPAYIAGELFLQGRAPYVVLTGGVNHRTGENEARHHYVLLREAGVPGDRILVEDRSTNTAENVAFALALIHEDYPVLTVGSVLAVCKWMHSRRALMTLKRHFPPGIRYYAATYEPAGVPRANWWENPRAATANVLKEWEVIPELLRSGQIEEIRRAGDSYV
jgi:hypothetical protein